MPLKITPPDLMTEQPSENQNEEKILKEFVDEANKNIALDETSFNEKIEETFPWEAPTVQEDVIKLFNLRLREPDWLKLKYIADHANKSMHTICLEILRAAMYRRIRKLISENF